MDKDEFKNAFGIEKNEDYIEYISKNILKFFNIGEKEFMKNILKLMQNKLVYIFSGSQYKENGESKEIYYDEEHDKLTYFS